VGADLLDRLDEAQQDNRIVAIVVDTWTLRVSEFSDVIKAFDKRNYMNCVVLVLWNPQDQEITDDTRKTLEDALLDSLRNNKLTKDRKYFIDPINSPEEFKTSVTAALHTIKAQILAMAPVEKKAGDEIIARPIL
jgi:FxsC-like protein